MVHVLQAQKKKDDEEEPSLNIYFAHPDGKAYHSDRDCHYLKQAKKAAKLFPCTKCDSARSIAAAWETKKVR